MTKRLNKKIRDCWNIEGVWGASPEKCEKLHEVTHCRNCEVFEQAARLVFENRPPAGYKQEWSENIRFPQESQESDQVSGIVFRIHDEWFLLDVKCFEKVSDVRPVHCIPHNEDSFVDGLVNIDGAIRLCFSLSDLLGVTRSDVDGVTGGMKVFKRFIVTSIEGSGYVFQADEVKGVERFFKDDLLSTPASYVDSMKGLVPAVINSEIGMLNMLDHQRIHQLIEAG
jgi:chemotaxis-related protein WspD